MNNKIKILGLSLLMGAIVAPAHAMLQIPQEARETAARNVMVSLMVDKPSLAEAINEARRVGLSQYEALFGQKFYEQLITQLAIKFDLSEKKVLESFKEFMSQTTYENLNEQFSKQGLESFFYDSGEESD